MHYSIKIRHPVADATHALWREIRNAIRHQVGVFRARRVHFRDQKLNVGCGKYPLPGWMNTDITGTPDVVFDIRGPWPIPDDQLKEVRLEHVLEHVEYPNGATHVLSECFRVLKPGGVVRIGVPDSALVINAYVEGNDAEYFRIARERWHPPEVRLPIEHLNYHFRDRYGEHLFAYDLDALKQKIANAGFLNIQRAVFNPEYDRADREAGTIRLVGCKPSRMETKL
jgi:predicted SAM-dependent methyltransferase